MTQRQKFYNTIETYTYPVTMNLKKWQNYVANNDNLLYGDSIFPDGSTMDGAVIKGHVRQNPMTAMIN
jgi:hypothetical protein